MTNNLTSYILAISLIVISIYMIMHFHKDTAPSKPQLLMVAMIVGIIYLYLVKRMCGKNYQVLLIFLIALLSLISYNFYISDERFQKPNYEDEIADTYDYVIVGLGAGGSVVAEVLAANDPDSSILVLEYGGHEVMDHILVKTPIHHPFLLGGPDFQPPYTPDYQMYKFPLEKDNSGYVGMYQRGTGFGGSTNHHSMVALRGQREVFDNWAAMTGDDRWSYDNCLKIFKKMERCEIKGLDPIYHGYDGWLGISDQPTETIQKDFGKACNQLYGMPYVNDFLNPNNIAGHGPFQCMIKDGQRSYAAKDFLKPHKNLRIKTRSLVTKLLFDKEKTRAIGVEYITYKKGEHPYKADTQYKPSSHPVKKVYARKEVILTAGAIQTAQLLLLSGIGPVEELSRHNISVVRDLPVGTNIQDHRDADVIHEIKPDSYQFNINKKANLVAYHDEYAKAGTGIAATNRFSYGYFWWVTKESMDLNPSRPDVHVYSWNGPLDVRDHNNKLILFDPNKFYHSTHIETMYPSTYGYIKLRNTNPFETPMIEENFGDNIKDNNILADAITQARQLWKSQALAKYEPVEVYPGPGIDAYDAQFYSSYGYHINGSARMGQVCNSDLTVKGIKGLRIADASVLPTNIGGNITMPLYMIGYQAAYAILAEKRLAYEDKMLYRVLLLEEENNIKN